MAEVTFASLSPSLLARKGGAKPAMRPQHAALAAMTAAEPMAAHAPDQLEDLGWNDMGDAEPGSATTAEVIQLTPQLTPMPHLDDAAAEVAPPAVVRQQEQLAERLEVPAPAAASAVAPAPRRRAAQQRTSRAAFTLRLDPQRHLKLRLATTIKGVSAQALVTEALDALLADMPEVDTLAAQVKRR